MPMVQLLTMLVDSLRRDMADKGLVPKYPVQTRPRQDKAADYAKYTLWTGRDSEQEQQGHEH